MLQLDVISIVAVASVCVVVPSTLLLSSHIRNAFFPRILCVVYCRAVLLPLCMLAIPSNIMCLSHIIRSLLCSTETLKLYDFATRSNVQSEWKIQ